MGRSTPAAWWLTILTLGPMLGSFITEPAAMTICALLLSRHFYELKPSRSLRYATLGLLFVNVSIGGTLTHFAAPPVLMVARPWGWDTPIHARAFRLACRAGHHARHALLLLLVFAPSWCRWRTARDTCEVDEPEDDHDAGTGSGADTSPLPAPAWITAIHVFFMAWTVFTAHYPALFIGGFLIFLGFAQATLRYQSLIDLKAPLLVGFFLGGLVIHGGLQGWWIAPVLGSFTETPLFLSSTLLTAFNDNALITYLATLVPISTTVEIAIVEGAVTGGGLTVIANAPNPAGQALLGRFFDNAIAPLSLLAGALLPTLFAAAAFFLL